MREAKHHKFVIHILFATAICIAFAIAFNLGCSKPTPYYNAKSIMGTNVRISIFDSGIGRSTIMTAVEDAFKEMEHIESLMSNYKEHSEVSRINRLKAGENIRISDGTMEVLRCSQKISALSGGAFDITVLPLMELWGFYSDSGIDRKPAKKEIRVVLKRVGFKKIKLGKGNSVTKGEDGVKIDLGGIAKGYAVDRAVRRLKSYGIKSAIIEAGGDLFCLGIKPDKNVWKIAIQHPRNKNKVIAILGVGECAIATSGDYENYEIIGGERYSHIIDPRTGYPTANVPASVTVVAKDTTTADALATAVFVLGTDKGMKLIEGLEEAEAVIISVEDGKIKSEASSGLKDKIKFIDN